MMPHIFINPAGAHEVAAYLLVLHPTGVHYSHHCAGYLTDLRKAEGFLIPLGGASVAKPLMDWFWKTFRGNSYSPPETWKPTVIRELHEQVALVVCWYTPENDADVKRRFVTLDDERLADCTEAWVPVKSPYGPGILIFPNSD